MLNDSTQYIPEGQPIRHFYAFSRDLSNYLQALKKREKIFFSFFRFLMNLP